jgi:hypothetical protein
VTQTAGLWESLPRQAATAKNNEAEESSEAARPDGMRIGAHNGEIDARLCVCAGVGRTTDGRRREAAR